MNEDTASHFPSGPRGRLLVVGGGITGLSAAVEAAEAGCGVVLVEAAPFLGGRVAQMHQYFPKLCPPLCGIELNLRRFRTSSRILVLTLAEVTEATERRGALRVTVVRRPRFVGDGCSACGQCVEACPAERRHDLDLGMRSTKAIYLPHPAATPTRYAIDREACLGPTCALCAAACPHGAIDLSMEARELEMDVQAVIWATGWDPYDPSSLRELGYGAHPDIITSLMLERLAASDGPTRGRILCPSDGRVPRRVAFIQCAGSRDQSHLPYCSAVCCLATAKQARYLRAAHPEVEIAVYSIDRRAQGTSERFLTETAEDPRVRYVSGKVGAVTVDEGSPVVEFEDVTSGRRGAESVDLVVLATGITPVRRRSGAERWLARDSDGFLLGEQPSPCHFVAGCARQPQDVASCVRDATRAVARALTWRSGEPPHEVLHG